MGPRRCAMPHDDDTLAPVHLRELRELHAALQADETPPVTPEKFRREPGGDANRTGEACRPGDAP